MESSNTRPGDPSLQTDEEVVYLPGAVALSDYVKYIQRRTSPRYQRAEAEIISQWNGIDDHYRALASSEENLADQIEIDPLPNNLQSLVDRVLEDRFFTRCFEALPVAFAMVELDKLIVIQEHVSLEHAARLSERLSVNADLEEVFKICLPFDRSSVPVSFVQDGTNSYVFQSESTDLRPFPAQILEDELTQRVPANGPLAAVVGLSVGFGPNYLSGLRYGKRIVLNNGYHRAYAIRSMGFTHVPMAIQVFSRAEEIAFISGAQKADLVQSLVDNKRPPMLKDFFDPLLVVKHRRQRLRRQIRVKMEVSVLDVPAG